MKLGLNLLLIALAFNVGTTGGSGLTIQSSAYAGVQGVVKKVIDGDTIKFQKGYNEGRGKDWNIRMIGIDAPETHLPVPGGPSVGQQPWGDQATRYLEKLAPVGTVVELDIFGRDQYGRILGRIENRRMDVNLEMVRSGWAIPYLICEGSACSANYFERFQVARYIKACDEARQNGKGVFNTRNPLKEMPFEFRLRIQKHEPNKYVGDYDTRKLYAPKEYNQVDVCRRIFFPSKEKANEVGFE